MVLSNIEIIRWVRVQARRHPKTIFSLCFIGFLAMIPSALNSFVIQRFIDRLTKGVFPLPLALLAIALTIMAMALNTYQEYIWQVKMKEGSKNLAGEVYAHLQTLPLSYFKSTSTGELMSKTLNDTDILGQSCVTYYPMLLLNLIQLLVSGAVLFSLEWRLALLAFAFLPLSYFLILQFNWRQREGWERERKNYARNVESLREKIEGISVIKGYHQEDFFKTFFVQDLNRWFKSLRQVLLYVRLSRGVVTHLTGVLATSLLIFGGLGAFYGWTSMGVVIAFFWYVGNLYSPIEGLVDWNNTRQQIIPMGKRVLGLLSVESDLEREGLPLPPCPTIALAKVSAGYDGNEILHSITTKLEYGRMNAIVGESGSGKSTLVTLLLGFNRPMQGELLISGVPLKEYGTRQLREGIAFATSASFLFNLSIRDNITLGGKYPEEEVLGATKKVEIHEFITGMPEGYNTVVGERGVRLSEGERQRIALARALIRRPQILILDEATSGIDSKTEAKIYESLRGQDLNLIVIAHRLSTIYRADWIAVLAERRIVGEGTHSELLQECPVYRAIFEKQLVESEANRA